jgi:hypothetical protein
MSKRQRVRSAAYRARRAARKAAKAAAQAMPTVLDSDGCTVTQTEESSLAAAKRSAREKLNEPCYRDGVKVEVSDADTGEIVWDQFVVRS